jgi:hypothetical protein
MKDNDLKRWLKLLKDCKDVECFKYGGRTYIGSKGAYASEFIKDNPDKGDFSVWLQKNKKHI